MPETSNKKFSFAVLTRSDGWIFGWMLFSAVISLIAAFVLSVDAVKLAENPNVNLNCNINSVISCGTVGVSWQAELFGFPNAFLGLMFEPIVITIAVAGLSGVKFKKWFMAGTQVLYLFAIVFALWLFTQSAFVIGAFCPWCLLVTLGTTVTFFTLLRFNILNDNLYLPKRFKSFLTSAVKVGADIALVMIIIITLLSIMVIKYGPQLLG